MKFITDNVANFLIALIPFLPNIYSTIFTEEKVQFLYETHYLKNPIEDWNEAIKTFTEKLDPKELEKQPPPLLLRAVGKEIMKSMPAMMAGMGIKPFDSIAVNIYNQSDKDLINTRINFIDCHGHYEIETAPDATGSIGHSIFEKDKNSTITVKYGTVPRKELQAYMAQAIYYGTDASKCKISVDAEFANGTVARGEMVKSISTQVTQDNEIASKRNSRFDFIWKIIISILLIYLFSSIRRLNKSER